MKNAKIKIADISFNKYLGLSGEDRNRYDYCLRYATILKEPLDVFEIGDIIDRTFGFVKDMQELLNYEGLTWQAYFNTLLTHNHIDSFKQAGETSLFTLQRSRIFIKEAIENVNKLESDGLGHKAGMEEEAAGISRFDKYRSFPQLDKLACGDVTKYEAVRKEPYGNCFTKLMLDSDRSDYEVQLNKVRTKNK